VTLPSGWISATLPELVGSDGLFVDGDWVESKDQDPAGDVRLIQLADVGDGLYIDKSNRFLTSAKAAELGCTFLRAGDVLIARMPDPLGRACIFPGNRRRSVTVVDVAVFRGGVDHSWLMYTLNAGQSRRAIATLSSGTTRSRISRGNLSTIKFPVAPLSEQRRIVARLDAIFEQTRAAKARLERLPALLDKLRRSILAAALRGDITADWRAKNPNVEPAEKLRERLDTGTEREADTWKAMAPEQSASGESDLPDLPAGWCWTTIGTVGDILNGRQRAEPTPGDATRPYLRIANIKDDEIAFDDVNDMAADPDTNAKYSLIPGDILVSAGQSLEKIGQSAMFLPGMPDVGFQKNIFRFRPNKTAITPEYAQLAFRTFVRTGVFLRRSSITTNLAYLTTTKFAECPFPLPPQREQLALVQLVTQLLDTAKAVEEQVVRLVGRTQVLDRSILAKAFRGELVPQDPNDEPAGELLARIQASAGDVDATSRRRRAAPTKTTTATAARTKRRASAAEK
jgi:type I restriction enzyme S subunit